jgi:hypothetical protein
MGRHTFQALSLWHQIHFVYNHQPIKWLMTNDKLTGKLARWAFIFQEYEFKIIN